MQALRTCLSQVRGTLLSHSWLIRLVRGLALAGLAGAHAVLLYALAGTLLAPALGLAFLRVEASRSLDREIHLKSLRFNPFTFECKASGLEVLEKGGTGVFAGFSQLEVNLDPLDLLGRRFTVSRFTLEDPVLRLARDAKGRLNMADLVPESTTPRPSSPPRTVELVPAGVRYSLSNIHITGGVVSFDDALTGLQHEMKDLHFSIESLTSEQPGLHEVFSTGGLVNESSLTLTVKAELTGDTPEAEVRLNIKDVIFRHYTPYILPLKNPLDVKMNEVGIWARMTLPSRKLGKGPPRVESTVKLSGVTLVGGGGQMAGFETLEVQGAAMDLENSRISVERVEINAPLLRVTRDEAGVIDLLAMLEPMSKQEEASTGQAGPGPGQFLSIGEVVLKGGLVEFNDLGLGLTTSLEAVQARLQGLDTASGRIESLSLDAGGDRFKRLLVTAKGGYKPLSLTGGASLEGFDLSKPLPALKRLLPKLGLSGTAGLTTTYSLDQKDGKLAPRIQAGLDIRDFRAMVEGQVAPLLATNVLSVAGAEADVGAQRVTVGQISLSGGGASLMRDANGGFPALSAFGNQEQGAAGKESGAWTVSVAQTRLAGFALEYQDSQTGSGERVELDELGIKDVTSSLDKPLAVSAKGRINTQASFALSGEIKPKDPSLALNLNVSGLQLGDLSRLVPQLRDTPLSGLASLSGDLTAAMGKDGPAASFKGDAGLADFKLTSPGKDTPWAAVAGLALKGSVFTLAPLEFKAASLSLDGPWISLTLDKDNKLVLPLSLPAASAPEKPSAPLSYGLDRLEIRNGSIEITDEGFDPPLTDRISDIQATLSDLRPAQPSRIELSLGVGHTGKFRAEGLAGWVSEAPMLDLRATLENMDLGELSPVSQKFTGFPLTRGKLGLKLDYKAGGRSLDLKNNIVVAGIQLGRKAGLPGGKDIPLDLAVSLLSDSKGVINLDIPVKGDISHAKVDLSEVISTAVAGAFTKILFSPLAFLNVSQSSGRTLFVSFPKGSAELTPEAQKDLTTMGAALANRPRLSLEVMAYVDPTVEEAAFTTALAAQQAAAKPPAAPVQEQAPKGRPGAAHPQQTAQPAPAQTPPQASSTPTKPTQADWARLARQRQDAVLAFLSGPGKLPQDRIFPVTGDALKPPKVQGQSGQRAEVRLRY